MIARFFIILFLATFLTLNASSQKIYKVDNKRNNIISVFKRKCICDTFSYRIGYLINAKNADKEYLKVRLQKKMYMKKMKEFLCDYRNNEILLTSDSMKIAAIESLLEFAGDTSIVCMKVYKYGPSKDTIEAIKYTLQIDALYNINYLTLGALTFKYSPVPIIIDTASNQSIEGDFQKISEVFSIYALWIKKNKKTAFKNYELPLSRTRYQWKFRLLADIMIPELPQYTLPSSIIGRRYSVK
jgi:uncharacterized protein with PIN domain